MSDDPAVCKKRNTIRVGRKEAGDWGLGSDCRALSRGDDHRSMRRSHPFDSTCADSCHTRLIQSARSIVQPLENTLSVRAGRSTDHGVAPMT